jgi:membrane protein YdbS with pleckstrin-like domain
MKDISENGTFKPAPQFKTLYYAYFLLSVIFFVVPWYLPVALFAPLMVTSFVSLMVLPLLVLILFWIPYYYSTIIYHFTDTDIEWKRGVWFKQTGIVPYNRITNVDISQGPLSRALRIASLKIQTAGYSAPSGTGGVSEMRVVGVEDFEEMQTNIMNYVRGKKPVAVETFEGDYSRDVLSQMLEELTRIRKLLERTQ